jgi:hypothetical protein
LIKENTRALGLLSVRNTSFLTNYERFARARFENKVRTDRRSRSISQRYSDAISTIVEDYWQEMLE